MKIPRTHTQQARNTRTNWCYDVVRRVCVHYYTYIRAYNKRYYYYSTTTSLLLVHVSYSQENFNDLKFDFMVGLFSYF